MQEVEPPDALGLDQTPDLAVRASSTTPLIDPPSRARKLPFLQRLRYSITLRFIKFFIDIGLRLLNLPGIRNKSVLPTFTKVYPCRPALMNRIFIPKSYKSGDAALPLYIDIHGGGFAWTNPTVDDKFCSTLSNEHSVLVVSLDYPKSPSHRFPVPVQALRDLVNAVLEDDTLPINRAKVAIGGFSAGGNLALAVSQDKTLQGKLGGVVAFYAAVSFSSNKVDKDLKLPNNAGSVLPRSHLSMFGWGYVGEGQDLTDPILSPTFAPRQNLPPKIYFIGCELDILCRQSEIMAEKMAGEDVGQRVGSDIVWEQNGVKWEKVLGEDHGFDQRIAFGAAKIRMKERARILHRSIAEWLFREVYV